MPKIYIWALLKETSAALKLATSSRKPNDLFVAEFLLTERAPSSRKTYKHWMEASICLNLILIRSQLQVLQSFKIDELFRINNFWILIYDTSWYVQLRNNMANL